MKKVILSIFAAGVLAFGLQSCGTDDPCDIITCPAGEICEDGLCVDDPNDVCEECGTYQGTVSSAPGDTLVVPGIIDSVLVDFPASATVAETSVANVLDLTVALTINMIPLAPTVEGTLAGSVLTVTGEVYNYSGINIGVDGSMTFAGDDVSGNLILSEGPSPSLPLSGNLVFTGSK